MSAEGALPVIRGQRKKAHTAHAGALPMLRPRVRSPVGSLSPVSASFHESPRGELIVDSGIQHTSCPLLESVKKLASDSSLLFAASDVPDDNVKPLRTPSDVVIEHLSAALAAITLTKRLHCPRCCHRQSLEQKQMEAPIEELVTAVSSIVIGDNVGRNDFAAILSLITRHDFAAVFGLRNCAACSSTVPLVGLQLPLALGSMLGRILHCLDTDVAAQCHCQLADLVESGIHPHLFIVIVTAMLPSRKQVMSFSPAVSPDFGFLVASEGNVGESAQNATERVLFALLCHVPLALGSDEKAEEEAAQPGHCDCGKPPETVDSEPLPPQSPPSLAKLELSFFARDAAVSSVQRDLASSALSSLDAAVQPSRSAVPNFHLSPVRGGSKKGSIRCRRSRAGTNTNASSQISVSSNESSRSMGSSIGFSRKSRSTLCFLEPVSTATGFSYTLRSDFRFCLGMSCCPEHGSSCDHDPKLICAVQSLMYLLIAAYSRARSVTAHWSKSLEEVVRSTALEISPEQLFHRRTGCDCVEAHKMTLFLLRLSALSATHSLAVLDYWSSTFPSGRSGFIACHISSQSMPQSNPDSFASWTIDALSQSWQKYVSHRHVDELEVLQRLGWVMCFYLRSSLSFPRNPTDMNEPANLSREGHHNSRLLSSLYCTHWLHTVAKQLGKIISSAIELSHDTSVPSSAIVLPLMRLIMILASALFEATSRACLSCPVLVETLVSIVIGSKPSSTSTDLSLMGWALHVRRLDLRLEEPLIERFNTTIMLLERCTIPFDVSFSELVHCDRQIPPHGMEIVFPCCDIQPFDDSPSATCKYIYDIDTLWRNLLTFCCHVRVLPINPVLSMPRTSPSTRALPRAVSRSLFSDGVSHGEFILNDFIDRNDVHSITESDSANFNKELCLRQIASMSVLLPKSLKSHTGLIQYHLIRCMSSFVQATPMTHVRAVLHCQALLCYLMSGSRHVMHLFEHCDFVPFLCQVIQNFLTTPVIKLPSSLCDSYQISRAQMPSAVPLTETLPDLPRAFLGTDRTIPKLCLDTVGGGMASALCTDHPDDPTFTDDTHSRRGSIPEGTGEIFPRSPSILSLESHSQSMDQSMDQSNHSLGSFSVSNRDNLTVNIPPATAYMLSHFTALLALLVSSEIKFMRTADVHNLKMTMLYKSTRNVAVVCRASAILCRLDLAFRVRNATGACEQSPFRLSTPPKTDASRFSLANHAAMWLRCFTPNLTMSSAVPTYAERPDHAGRYGTIHQVTGTNNVVKTVQFPKMSSPWSTDVMGDPSSELAALTAECTGLFNLIYEPNQDVLNSSKVPFLADVSIPVEWDKLSPDHPWHGWSSTSGNLVNLVSFSLHARSWVLEFEALKCDGKIGLSIDNWRADRVATMPPESFRRMCLRLFCDVVWAVVNLHDRGFAHYDLKPSNVIILHDTALDKSRAVLIDFGEALSLDADASVHLRRARGTLKLSAPEMLKQPLPVNIEESLARGKPDVWALGCLLLFLLFGADDTAQSDAATISQIISYETAEQILPTDKFAPNENQNVIAALRGMLEPDFTRRLTAIEVMLLSHRFGWTHGTLIPVTEPYFQSLQHRILR